MDGSILHALRAGLADLYFNASRLALANLVWGIGLVALIFGAAQSPAVLLLTGLLAAPLAGVHRMAALLARGEAVSFSDFLGGMRRYGVVAIVLGTAATIAAFVLVTNTLLGFEAGGPFGWFVGVSALYGLAALGTYLVVLWPVIVDPRHERESIRRRLALAGMVVLGRPGRSIGLAIVVTSLLGLSVLLFAAVVLISIALTSLIAARVVLPTLDELEARLPEGRLPG